MLDRVEVENYIKTLPIRDRLSLIFSDESVNWEDFGLPKGLAQSFGVGTTDYDAERVAKVHEVQMRVLDELLRVCNENGLKVYAIYGTLLGAVRNGGLIPGDDDVDVALMREDYDKLMSLLRESEKNGCPGGQGGLFSAGFFMQTPENSQCFYGGYLKFRDCGSTALHPHNWWSDCNEGIGIDVFPMDNGFKSPVREWIKNQKLVFLQRLLYAKAYGIFANFNDMPLLIFKGYKYFGKLFSKKAIVKALDKVMKSGDKLEFSKKQKFGIYAHYTKGKGLSRKFNAEHFKESIEKDYEGRKLWAPAEYKKCLSLWYGDQFMILSQAEFAKTRHGFCVPDVPYQNYKSRMAGLFKDYAGDKKIVLFGDETWIPYYKQKWGNYNPELIVNAGVRDESDEKSFIENLKEIEAKRSLDDGEIYDKVCVDSGFKLREMDLNNPYKYAKSQPSYDDVRYVEPEEFFTEDANLDAYYFVVCSLYVREVEEKLRLYGVRNYHIYVPNQHRDWLLLEDPRYVLLYTNIR